MEHVTGSWRRRPAAADSVEIMVGERLQVGRQRVHRIENEAPQKLRRLDGERLFACHQEL